VYAVNSWQTAEQPGHVLEAPADESLSIENAPAEAPSGAADPSASGPQPAAAPSAVNLPAAKPAAKAPTAPPTQAAAETPAVSAVPPATARSTQPAPPPVNLPTVLARLDAPAGSAAGAPADASDSLTLTIEATDAGWVAARIDGNEMKEVYLEAGEKVTWRASDGFVLSLGNAGGVKVELNGKPLGPLGSKGAVVKNILID
jgi:hypothetical protein